MKIINISWCLGVIVVSIMSCQVKQLDPSTYRAWYLDNKAALSTVKPIGKIIWSVEYMPAAIMALREYGSGTNPIQLSELITTYQDAEYYILSVSSKDLIAPILTMSSTSLNDYTQAITYFSYEFQSTISLIRDQDTLPCTLFHFEQSMAEQARIEFLIAFSPAQKQFRSRTLRIEDQYFGLGPINISLPSNVINSAPTLTIIEP